MISRALAPNTRLGDYVVGTPQWPLRAADAYRAVGPQGPATLYVVHTAIALTRPQPAGAVPGEALDAGPGPDDPSPG